MDKLEFTTEELALVTTCLDIVRYRLEPGLVKVGTVEQYEQAIDQVELKALSDRLWKEFLERSKT